MSFSEQIREKIFNNYQFVLMSKPDSYILRKLHLVITVLTSLLANSFAQGLALKNSFCQGLTDFQPANECHNNLLYWHICCWI